MVLLFRTIIAIGRLRGRHGRNREVPSLAPGDKADVGGRLQSHSTGRDLGCHPLPSLSFLWGQCPASPGALPQLLDPRTLWQRPRRGAFLSQGAVAGAAAGGTLGRPSTSGRHPLGQLGYRAVFGIMRNVSLTEPLSKATERGTWLSLLSTPAS